MYANAQWSGLVAPKHTLTAGADTRRDYARNAVAQAPDYLQRASTAAPDVFATGRTFQQAAYVQDQIAVSNALQLTVGGRVDYWRTYDGMNQTSIAAGAVSYPTRSTTSMTGKIAAVYRAGAATVLRASFGNAFRNPSVYELYANTRLSSGLQLLANPNVTPERMLSWEGGVRQNIGKRANLDAAYFDNRVDDLIYRVTDFAADPTGNLRYLTNAAQGRTRGVELSATQRPIPALTLRETYTYTDAVITKNPSLPDTEGKDIPYVPRHATSVSATVVKGRWTIAATARQQSVIFTVDTNTDVVHDVPGGYSAFSEANLSVNYKLSSKLTAYVNVDDLFDQRYYMFYINPGRLFLAGVRLRY
jgi:iron complex outermembrane receptor protein